MAACVGIRSRSLVQKQPAVADREPGSKWPLLGQAPSGCQRQSPRLIVILGITFDNPDWGRGGVGSYNQSTGINAHHTAIVSTNPASGFVGASMWGGRVDWAGIEDHGHFLVKEACLVDPLTPLNDLIAQHHPNDKEEASAHANWRQGWTATAS